MLQFRFIGVLFVHFLEWPSQRRPYCDEETHLQPTHINSCAVLSIFFHLFILWPKKQKRPCRVRPTSPTTSSFPRPLQIETWLTLFSDLLEACGFHFLSTFAYWISNTECALNCPPTRVEASGVSAPLNLCHFSPCYCQDNPAAFINLHLMIAWQRRQIRQVIAKSAAPRKQAQFGGRELPGGTQGETSSLPSSLGALRGAATRLGPPQSAHISRGGRFLIASLDNPSACRAGGSCGRLSFAGR